MSEDPTSHRQLHLSSTCSCTAGPLGLTLHALLGTALLVVALRLILRAECLGRRFVIILTSVGALAILSAAFNGTQFIGDSNSAASLTMGIAATVALLAYSIILFSLHPVVLASNAVFGER